MTQAVSLTASVIAAYVAANKLSAGDLPAVISSVHAALSRLDTPEPQAVEVASEVKSKLEIRKSITPEALISFLDGRPYRSLKRHLTANGLTVQAYRARFGLPDDYPTVAPNYSARRSELAKASGLGQVRRQAATPDVAPASGSESAAPAPAPAPKRTRQRKAAS